MNKYFFIALAFIAVIIFIGFFFRGIRVEVTPANPVPAKVEKVQTNVCSSVDCGKGA